MAIEAAEYFDIKSNYAETITEEILNVVRNNWEQLATIYGISREQVEEMRPAFDICYK